MWRLRNFRKIIIYLCNAAIFAAMVVAFAFVQIEFYPEAKFFFKGNIILAGLYALLLVLFSFIYGGFRVSTSRITELMFSLTLSLFITDFISYFVLCLISSKMLSVWPMLMLFAITAAGGSVLLALVHRLYGRIYPARDTVVIASASGADAAAIQKLRGLGDRYALRSVLCETDERADMICAMDAANTVVFGNIDVKVRDELMMWCFEHNRNVILLPRIGDIVINNGDAVQIGDVLVYRCDNRLPGIDRLAIKRLMDIAFSLIGLIITLPFMAIVAIAIKCDTPGPVFYRQKRLTRNGKEFMLVKFRSMAVAAEESGAQFAVKDDDRITKVGRAIRGVRMDELPQLWNILIGDMSLVGPRPERPEMYEEGCRIYPAFRYRLKVKAGLTGFAQVYGKYNTSFEDKARMDLVYIEKCSLLLDLRLLFYTIKILFMKESTEGFDKK